MANNNIYYNPETQTFQNNDGAYYSPDAAFDMMFGDSDNPMTFLKAEQNFNSAEAQKNRDFQEYMSNTAFQRMIKDIEAAGYNPWLALNSGGAAVGSGSTASSSGSSAASVFGSKKQQDTADKDRLADVFRTILSFVGTAMMVSAML